MMTQDDTNLNIVTFGCSDQCVPGILDSPSIHIVPDRPRNLLVCITGCHPSRDFVDSATTKVNVSELVTEAPNKICFCGRLGTVAVVKMNSDKLQLVLTGTSKIG
jgi:hypothetical protein